MVFSNSGVLPAAAVEDLIRQIRELPMDDIRAKMEADAKAREAGMGAGGGCGCGGCNCGRAESKETAAQA